MQFGIPGSKLLFWLGEASYWAHRFWLDHARHWGQGRVQRPLLHAQQRQQTGTGRGDVLALAKSLLTAAPMSLSQWLAQPCKMPIPEACIVYIMILIKDAAYTSSSAICSAVRDALEDIKYSRHEQDQASQG